jgi:hypothetical protein
MEEGEQRQYQNEQTASLTKNILKTSRIAKGIN